MENEKLFDEEFVRMIPTLDKLIEGLKQQLNK